MCPDDSRPRFHAAGVPLRGPVIVASGPLTSRLSLLRLADSAGAGAVSLKLTFLKPPFAGEMRSFSVLDSVILSPVERRLAIDEGVELCRNAKAETSLPVWANYSAGDPDEWLVLTEAFLAAGADGLELNFCCPNLDTSYGRGARSSTHAGALICTDPDLVVSIVRNVAEHFPEARLLPKIVNNTHLFREVVGAVAEGGASGVHVVGQPVSGAPPVDPDTLKPVLPFADGVSFGSTNGSVCLYNTLKCVAEARLAAPKLDIVASGGVSDWSDCVSMYAYGADAVALCSAVMWHGWKLVSSISENLLRYFDARGIDGPAAVRDAALQHLVSPAHLRLSPLRASVDVDKCAGCGRCLSIGHCEAVSLRDGKAFIDPALCMSCGVCRSVCPADAIVYDDDPRCRKEP
ncbi:MAG: 4Fe-4S binding protein [Planctomycetes bacterium]|nr:4Fe-4S binding protein [Planctomycetota bacterium]